MSNTTTLAEVQAQVQKFWSSLFMQELREDTLLIDLVNRDYQGDIKKQGNTVQVSQIQKPEGELQTIQNGDGNTFKSEKLVTKEVDIKADKRALASFEFDDLVDLQSQIQTDSSEIREALLAAVREQINDDLYSIIAPKASLDLTGGSAVASMSAAQVNTLRKLAAQNKWKKDGWWLLLDPEYYTEVLNDTQAVSSDFQLADGATSSGRLVLPRYGFNILEDNSREAGKAGFPAGASKFGLALQKDFLYMVMQREARFKLSDLHVIGKFGFKLSVDIIYGRTIGIDGDSKHIRVANA